MAFSLDPAFIGIPYLDRGRDPAVGLDCWGLPMLFYRRLMGIELPSLLDGYGSADDHAGVTALVRLQCAGWTRRERPVFGSLVTLNIAGKPWHVGICLDERHMLHTMEDLGSIIDRFDSPRWAPRVEAFWSYGRN